MQQSINEESIELLLFLSKKEKEFRRGTVKKTKTQDPDRLPVLLEAYRKRALDPEERDHPAAMITLQLALMTGPSNRKFMDYCIKRGLFYNLAVIARCFPASEEKLLSGDLIRSFTDKTGYKREENLLPVMCQIASVLPESMKKEIVENIEKNPRKCTLQGLYYALSDHVVKMTPSITEYIKKEIDLYDHKKIRRASFDNPIYTVLRLYKEGCINSVSMFLSGIDDEFITNIAFFPERLGVDDFDPTWWKILSLHDHRRILSRPEGRDIFDKIMRVKSPVYCPFKAAMCGTYKDMAYRRIASKTLEKNGSKAYH